LVEIPDGELERLWESVHTLEDEVSKLRALNAGFAKMLVALLTGEVQPIPNGQDRPDIATYREALNPALDEIIRIFGQETRPLDDD
jgi:hypothetical protein